jgi:predicted GIY-YIG superfamily endonuclease
MTFWTHILRCSDSSYYTGHTDNLEQRFGQHQLGEIPGFTEKRRPVQLVFSQEFSTREEALAAELQIKRWSRKKKEALMWGDWVALKLAAKKKLDG